MRGAPWRVVNVSQIAIVATRATSNGAATTTARSTTIMRLDPPDEQD
jgi:hypothetical protein